MNERLWTKDFISVSLSAFFAFLVFYTLTATLPIYVLNDLGQKQSQVGLVITVFLISAVIIRPFCGIWLDTIGRRKILISSLAFFAITTFFYLIVNNFFGLLTLRFIQGISFGLATTALGTIVAEIIPPKRRGEGMSYFSSAMILAMVFGPFLGITFMNHFSFSILFLVCGIFGILSFVFGMTTNIPKQSINAKTPIRFSNLIERKALPISLTAAFISFGYSSIMSFITLYANELGFVEIASFFFIVYAVVVLMSRPFTGKLFDRKGENIIIYPGIIVFSIGLIVLGFSNIPSIFLLSAVLIGLGYGSIAPSFQTLAINTAAPARKGMATATYFMFFDIGIGLGSFVLGIVTAKTSFHSMYVLSALIVLVTTVIYYLLHDRKQKVVPEISKQAA
ncbi:MFS transporter [Bacillus sp. OAE603]|uniref:MFS transporter n=1 Tax=Gottfriedia sp. OAE603 TaxID=2663872 RepID=UPI0017899CA4